MFLNIQVYGPSTFAIFISYHSTTKKVYKFICRQNKVKVKVDQSYLLFPKPSTIVIWSLGQYKIFDWPFFHTHYIMSMFEMLNYCISIICPKSKSKFYYHKTNFIKKFNYFLHSILIHLYLCFYYDSYSSILLFQK